MRDITQTDQKYLTMTFANQTLTPLEIFTTQPEGTPSFY